MDVLKIGSQGENVKKLQEQLAKFNYYTGVVDGDFGEATKQAVIKLQQDYKLEVNGLCDLETMKKIDFIKSLQN
ncbi:Peptidoglycan-binding domain 1 protein [Crinalium epipsammum PCC 9333]|uniref:Peptidoglycan-binding domain 1 protein n=1 Tax=Crinalium epipsammum PCC 9333 TaxID=1173022 RepID=K9W1L5_9CYAN|nr:peptidoglycan-binding domain-containing protein [Crinalium epipsammum]AFZ13689.1 Peptidoglycan-binding domain 1 protein [Crinalium epipsammum PCC 9333]